MQNMYCRSAGRCYNYIIQSSQRYRVLTTTRSEYPHHFTTTPGYQPKAVPPSSMRLDEILDGWSLGKVERKWGINSKKQLQRTVRCFWSCCKEFGNVEVVRQDYYWSVCYLITFESSMTKTKASGIARKIVVQQAAMHLKANRRSQESRGHPGMCKARTRSISGIKRKLSDPPQAPVYVTF